MLAIIMILIGILLRFAPHAPNFTPVAAIALFAGVYMNRKYAVIVPLALMILSDFAIGLHNVVLFTWGGFMLIGLLGIWLRSRQTPFRMVSTSVLSAVLFYLVSNFGVWLMGWYPRNPQGLINCYIMALPFLRNFTVATVIYGAVFFGAYEIIARRVKDTRLAKVLLTK